MLSKLKFLLLTQCLKWGSTLFCGDDRWRTMVLNFSKLKTQLLVEAALAVAIAVMRSLKSGCISTKVSHQSTCKYYVHRSRKRSSARLINDCAIDR